MKIYSQSEKFVPNSNFLSEKPPADPKRCSGSARGFFLLKGSCFSPQSPHACSGRGIGQEKFRCNLLVSLASKLFLNWISQYELD